MANNQQVAVAAPAWVTLCENANLDTTCLDLLKEFGTEIPLEDDMVIIMNLLVHFDSKSSQLREV